MHKAPANPWNTFLFTGGLGVAAMGAGMYIYNDLAEWEQMGGTRVMNSTIALLYRSVGKTGILIAGLLAGGFLLTMGILELRKKLKQRDEAESPRSG